MTTIGLKNLTVADLDEDAVGPTRRLVAACSSAAHRGSVDVGLLEISREISMDDKKATYALTISSIGGYMTSRAYFFAGWVTVSVDSYGVTYVSCHNVTAVVLNNEHIEGTIFTGAGVNSAYARLFRQVVMRDLALVNLGLGQPLQKPKDLYKWAEQLGLKLELTDQIEEPRTFDEVNPTDDKVAAPEPEDDEDVDHWYTDINV